MRRARACAVVAVCLIPGGCFVGGPKNFENDNDALRRERIGLREQIGALEVERDELLARVAEAERGRETAMDLDILGAIPRCAGIEIKTLSGLVDSDGVRGWDAVEVYLNPYDGRRRFVQAVGRMTVEVVLMPPMGEGEGERIGLVELGPMEVREAYRTGLMWTHYTVRVGLPRANEGLTGDLVIRAALTDAVTGLTHRAEMMKRIRAPGSSLGGIGTSGVEIFEDR